MTEAQLKVSILKMAVEGKLVAQDKTDESAAALLKQIKKEKQKLIKEGKLKKSKHTSEIYRRDGSFFEKVDGVERCIDEELPFKIPAGWEWVRLENIAYLVGNKNNQIKESEIRKEGSIPVVSQGQRIIEGYTDEKIKVINDLPLVMFGDHTRNVKYIDFEFVIGADGTKFHKIILCNAKYIYYWMTYSAEILKNRGYARHYSLLKNCFLPLPPLAEQKRIVEKMEEILPLVTEYGKNERALDTLDKEFPLAIKKSILQDAVMGKLVAQDITDESAAALLKRIKKEKQKLIKDKKLKKLAHTSEIYRRDGSFFEKMDGVERCIDKVVPFKIPEGWEWVRLGELVQVNPRNILPNNMDVGFIPMTMIDSGFTSHHLYETKKWSDVKSGFTHFKNNDAVIAKITPCFQNRKSAIITNLPNGYGAGTTELHVLRDDTNLLCMPYLLLFCKTNKFITEGVKYFTGTAGQQRIGKNFIENCLLPLPPLAEQKRIVKKVEELFAVVAGIESKV